MNKIALTVLLTNVLFVNENAVAQNAEESLSGTDNWIISETTSPVDYSPLVAATTRSRDSIESSAMQLSIYCRNGRTYVVLAGQAISGRGENYAISYSVNGDKPVRAGVSSSSFGSGTALKGDVVSFLQSLPDEGEIVIRSATQAGSAWEGNFSLRGLKVVRSKIAAACKWPRVNTEPRH